MNNKNRKVLVIDDEKMIGNTIGNFLEISGYNVDYAANGEDGLKLFKEIKHDIVLTDFSMRGMNGLDVLKQVENDSPDTPVIVISGSAGMSDIIDVLKSGAWDYFTKPIHDFALLEHSVEKCLERASLMRENAEHRENLEILVQQRTEEPKSSLKQWS